MNTCGDIGYGLGYTELLVGEDVSFLEGYSWSVAFKTKYSSVTFEVYDGENLRSEIVSKINIGKIK